jgi:hypothetical protein
LPGAFMPMRAPRRSTLPRRRGLGQDRLQPDQPPPWQHRDQPGADHAGPIAASAHPTASSRPPTTRLPTIR